MSSKVSLLVLLILSLWNNSHAYWPCPEVADITPCICTSDIDYKLYMDCSEVADDNELARAFQAEMPFPDYESLLIEKTDPNKTNIDILNRTTFGPAYFNMVRIEATPLAEVRDGAFQNSEPSLISLRLPSNSLDYFTFEALPLFIVLEELDLSENLFSDPAVPQIISNSLKILDISYNPAWDIVNRDTFSSCPLLETLNLEGMDLTDTPVDTFTDLQNLMHLNLNGNRLTTLYTGQITSPSKNLKDLTIDYNQITTIEPDSILNMDSYGELSMENNSIVLLAESSWGNIFEDLLGLQSIDLSGNPLRCGCEMAWLYEDTLLSSRLSDDTTCSDGTNVHTLETSFFDNCS